MEKKRTIFFIDHPGFYHSRSAPWLIPNRGDATAGGCTQIGCTCCRRRSSIAKTWRVKSRRCWISGTPISDCCHRIELCLSALASAECAGCCSRRQARCDQGKCATPPTRGNTFDRSLAMETGENPALVPLIRPPSPYSKPRERPTACTAIARGSYSME